MPNESFPGRSDGNETTADQHSVNLAKDGDFQQGPENQSASTSHPLDDYATKVMVRVNSNMEYNMGALHGNFEGIKVFARHYPEPSTVVLNQFFCFLLVNSLCLLPT